jgi:diaminopimelate decarboxylase
VNVLPASALIEDGRLLLADIPASDLAAEFGTPLYVYCTETLRLRSAAFVEALGSYPGESRAVFACKANATVGVLREVLAQGLGADVASEGELIAALSAGARPEHLVVHGNNKSDADIRSAVVAGAGLLVIDHMAELEQVEEIAAEVGTVQRIAVRITPGIVADTHAKIVTGHDTSKFGLAPPDALDALDRARELPHLEAAGLHIHLGSQIRDLSTYEQAVDWLVELLSDHGVGEMPLLNLGGGFGIAYTEQEIELPVPDAVEALVLCLAERLIARGLPLPELVIEPGRSIAGPAGVTLYTVGAIKQTAGGVTYAAVDGGMSDNPRPALYGARYEAVVCDRAEEPPSATYRIAGKHCESGDVLIDRVELPELRPGDVLATPVTGAYAASMASTYNLVPRPAAVMVDGGRARLIQRRETIRDLLSREV